MMITILDLKAFRAALWKRWSFRNLLYHQCQKQTIARLLGINTSSFIRNKQNEGRSLFNVKDLSKATQLIFLQT